MRFGRYPNDRMRVLTIVNLILWFVVFAIWAPYTASVGIYDTISVEVGWILFITAVLMGLLALLRIRRGRRVLG